VCYDKRNHEDSREGAGLEVVDSASLRRGTRLGASPGTVEARHFWR
jgi:hypothetical protein